MADYKKVYESQAETYETLVSREDCFGQILPALVRACPLEGKEMVELGAGTGRITRLLAPRAKAVRAFDAYPAMVEEGRRQMAKRGLANVAFAVAENKSIPVADRSADLTVAGWTFGHCVSWYPERWRAEITCAVREMLRITRAGGTAVILETLGTGREEPRAPSPGLAEYYALLEHEFGFTREWIRTDYRFSSAEEADSLTQAFFGKTYPLQLGFDGSAVLPECTGVWSLRRA